MAYAPSQATGNGSNKLFTFSFSYISKSHVHVYVDGVETTSFTWATSNSIELNSAPANGSVVLIKRITPIDSPIVDFVDGSTLQETDLDLSALQNLYASQETQNDALGGLIQAADGTLDAQGKRIKNLAAPASDTDAVTKQYVDQTALGSLPLPLSIANGGTGASTASGARTALGLGSMATRNASEFEPTDHNILRTSDIGVSVQAYDANTAKKNTAQDWSVPQRSSPLTDNDLSFDLSAKQNFSCTPTGAGTLTFTNLQAGQAGTIILTNSSNYSISKAASVKTDSAFLALVSATGTYRLSYYCDGTSVYVTTSGALS